jgi:hypothetical protein
VRRSREHFQRHLGLQEELNRIEYELDKFKEKSGQEKRSQGGVQRDEVKCKEDEGGGR